ncbi:MAG: ShlB/FhaC/HecB family hemolysin secretion/activation protein [Francisellaceae bacterium]|nr:ShlB/FhaC/HecB family hemolysin secretion/activation protein [Francisellaceae bacterium]
MLRRMSLAILFNLIFIGSAYSIDITEINAGRVGQEFLDVEQLTIEVDKPYTPPKEKRVSFGENEEAIFTLNEVKIDGSSVFSQEELMQTYKSKLGSKISIEELYEIVRNITNMYHKSGYTLSRALLAPQVMKNGVVYIPVIEGYINKVNHNVDANVGGDVYNKFVENITNEKPSKEVSIKRYLSLIGDIPGVEIKEINYFFGSHGAIDINIDMEIKKFEFYAETNNIINKIFGSSQVIAALTANETSIAGSTQLLTLQSTNVSRLNFYQIEHEQNIGGDGLKLQLTGQMTRVKPKFRGADEFANESNVRGRASRANISVLYPIIRSQQKNLLVFGSADAQTVDSTQDSGASLEFNDKVRSLKLGLSFETLDYMFGKSLYANNIFNIIVSKGFLILGAKKVPSSNDKPFSIVGGRPDFTKINVNYERLQDLSKSFYLKLEMGGQYAFTELLSVEEYGIGGTVYGRGYDSVVVSGEHALAMNLELGHDSIVNFSVFNNFRKYVYYDAGSVWNKNQAQRVNGARTSANSSGIGGMVTMFDDQVSAVVELGKPLSRNSNNGNKNIQIFFKLIGTL